MITRRHVLQTGLTSLMLGGAAKASPQVKPPCHDGGDLDQDRIDTAVSLAAVERALAACPADFGCAKGARALFGLKIVDGILVDPEASDLILIGRSTEGLAPLNLDDLMVMLRHADMAYAEIIKETPTEIVRQFSWPGVSIDIRPETVNALNGLAAKITNFSDYDTKWPKICKLPMDTRVLGIMPQCHAAARLLEADQLLKFISNNLYEFDAIRSITSRRVAAVLKSVATGEPIAERNSLTRFWFTTGMHEIIEGQGVFLFNRADVQLLDEAEHLTRAGKIEPTGDVNQMARDFSCAFTRVLPGLGESSEEPVLKQMVDIFRWALTANLIKHAGLLSHTRLALPSLRGAMPLQAYDIPKTLSGVARVYQWPRDGNPKDGPQNLRFVLPSCGGVEVNYGDLDTYIRSAPDARIAGLRARVLTARPNAQSLVWRV